MRKMLAGVGRAAEPTTSLKRRRRLPKSKRDERDERQEQEEEEEEEEGISV